MNKNLVTIILLIACAGLAVALIVARNAEREKEATNTNTILDFSNQLTTARDQITGLSQVNLLLTNDLATSHKESEALSNQLSDTKLTAAQEQQQLVDLTNQLAALEQRNQELDQHAAELTNQLSQLNDEISTTELKLSQAQTNNSYLEDELKKQVAERTALEQKFNDLSQMRVQVRKLRDDALIATRLKWIKEGTDPSQQVKGAQMLMQQHPPAIAAQQSSPSDLNVEVESGGAIRVLPQTGTPTNSPATNSP